MPRKKSPSFCLIYVTLANLAQARALGRRVVEERLAACVNLLPGMRSVYRWQGRLCEDHECVLIAKTTAARRTALMRRIRDLHTYACPCIVALPIVAGHRPFLEWLAANTAATTGR